MVLSRPPFTFMPMPPPVASAMPGARRASTSGSRPLTARFSMAAESTAKLRVASRDCTSTTRVLTVDRLRHRAELQRDHAERQAVRGVDDDVGLFDGLERVHRHLQVVGIRQQVEEHEVAGLVGRRHLRVVAPRAGQLDRRSRHRCALPVPHRSRRRNRAWTAPRRLIRSRAPSPRIATRARQLLQLFNTFSPPRRETNPPGPCWVDLRPAAATGGCARTPPHGAVASKTTIHRQRTRA